jgi:glycoside/pentoside/hexuronide:cation symporter, GPH family
VALVNGSPQPPRSRAHLSLGARLLYASAHLGVSALAFSVMQYIGYFWTGSAERGLPTRIDPAFVGIALLVGRFLDALIDPLVGFWSDRTRTRWGRRKPFLLAGILPVTLGFVMLWWSPSPTASVGNFVYLLGALTLFYFAFTVVSCPYLALLPEIASSDEERVGLASLQAVFNVVGNILGAVGGGILIQNPATGFLGMGLAIGALSAVTFVLAALGPGEREGGVRPHATELGLREAFRHTFRNRPFAHYGISFMVFWIGLSVVIANETYIATELLGRSEADAGLLTGVALIAAALCVPLTMRVTLRWGKRAIFLASLGWFAAVAPLLGFVADSPLPLDRFLQAVVLMALAGPPISGLLVMPYALLADITDEDERVTGRRREAMYFGVNGFLHKAGLALGGAVAAFAWRFLGHTAASPLGLRLSGVIAAVCALAGLAAFWGYAAAPSPGREA